MTLTEVLVKFESGTGLIIKALSEVEFDEDTYCNNLAFTA